MEILPGNAPFTLLAAVLAAGAILVALSKRAAGDQTHSVSSLELDGAVRNEMMRHLKNSFRRLLTEFILCLSLVLLIMVRIVWAALLRARSSCVPPALDIAILVSMVCLFAYLWSLEHTSAEASRDRVNALVALGPKGCPCPMMVPGGVPDSPAE